MTHQELTQQVVALMKELGLKYKAKTGRYCNLNYTVDIAVGFQVRVLSAPTDSNLSVSIHLPSTDRDKEWFRADEAVEGIKTYLRLFDYPVDKLLRKRRLRALLK